MVAASVFGFDGQLTIFMPLGPCYRCLYPTPPPAELAPSCGANGVLGVLPGTMGLLQSTEVIKLIVGSGDPLIGRLLLYDALAATFTELKVAATRSARSARRTRARSPTRRWACSRTTKPFVPRPVSSQR